MPSTFVKTHCIISGVRQFNETSVWIPRFSAVLIRLSSVTRAWTIIFILAACPISLIDPKVIIPVFSDSEYFFIL